MNKKPTANAPTMPPKKKINFSALGRVIKMLYQAYPSLVIITAICILFSAAVSAIPGVFIQKILSAITDALENGTPWAEASKIILPNIITLIILYILSLISTTLYNQLCA